MKISLFAALFTVISVFGLATSAYASDAASQNIVLSSGWNIVSTPKVVETHAFSATENASNFDIYVLDASSPTGWATMSDLGQTEFTPLFGYFVQNKTGAEQTLTLNYKTDLLPNEKLFEREFSAQGWYSIGVANDEYAKEQNDNRDDENNPSKILSLLNGKFDLVIDFTDAIYEADRKSPALSNPWKAVVPEDVNALNDLRDTKGYAIYIKEPGARYIGLQNEASTTAVGGADELTITASSEDPDSTTLAVEENGNSDWHTVFAFDLNADDSINDIEVNTAVASVTVSDVYDDVVHSARLVVDGVTYSDVTITGGTTATAILTFDTDGLIVELGERVTAELQIQFKGTSGDVPYAEGTTVQAMTAASLGWGAEGDDDLTVEPTENAELSGSATGEVHALRTAGIVVEPGGHSTDTQGENDTVGIFEIEFEVTAFEEDVYIAEKATSTNDDANGGVYYSVVGPGTNTEAGVLSSTADEDTAGVFTVREGETESFTLTVTVTTDTTGQYRVLLNDIWFTEHPDGVTDLQTDPASPASDYRTDYENINSD